MHRRNKPHTLRPRPVRQDMRHTQPRPPPALIQKKPVFLKSREVDDTEVRAARRIIRRRLAEVVPPGPDELARDEGVAVLRCEDFVRRGAKVCGVEFVGGDVVGRGVAAAGGVNGGAGAGRDGEDVGPACAEGCGSFAAQEQFLREGGVEGWVEGWGFYTREVGVGGGVADAFALVV
jgi:hypothetical protein